MEILTNQKRLKVKLKTLKQCDHFMSFHRIRNIKGFFMFLAFGIQNQYEKYILKPYEYETYFNQPRPSQMLNEDSGHAERSYFHDVSSTKMLSLRKLDLVQISTTGQVKKPGVIS